MAPFAGAIVPVAAPVVSLPQVLPAPVSEPIAAGDGICNSAGACTVFGGAPRFPMLDRFPMSDDATSAAPATPTYGSLLARTSNAAADVMRSSANIVTPLGAPAAIAATASSLAAILWVLGGGFSSGSTPATAPSAPSSSANSKAPRTGGDWQAILPVAALCAALLSYLRTARPTGPRFSMEYAPVPPPP
jgi:hypothetical protein